MANESISRRDILRTLAFGAAGGSVLQVILRRPPSSPPDGAQGESCSPAGSTFPSFSAPQYATVTFLSMHHPKDEKSGGAVEAGAPEFIDLLTARTRIQLRLGGGLFWLDAPHGSLRQRLHGMHPEQKKEIMDLIAFRKNAKQDASLSQGWPSLLSTQSHHRRLLHQQNRYRRPSIYRQHLAARVPWLPPPPDEVNDPSLSLAQRGRKTSFTDRPCSYGTEAIGRSLA